MSPHTLAGVKTLDHRDHVNIWLPNKTSNYFPKIPIYTPTQNTGTCTKVLVAPYSYSPWVFPILPTSALLRGVVVWTVLLGEFLEHLFTCLLDIRVFSFGKYLLICLTHIPLSSFFCFLIAKKLKNTL